MYNAEDKVMTLEASTYSDLHKHSKIFNASAVDYFLYIYLNPEDVRDATFLGAQEIGPEADNSKIFKDTFERDHQCWIKVGTPWLNTKIGKHIYKLDFIDRITDVCFSLYITYYIQNDNPDKPYVYMKDDGASTPVSDNEPTYIPNRV